MDFIPWYESSPNGLVYMNGFKLESGLPPTVAQVAQNSSISAPSPTGASSGQLSALLANETFLIDIAQNMFKAHRDWIGQSTGAPPAAYLRCSCLTPIVLD